MTSPSTLGLHGTWYATQYRLSDLNDNERASFDDIADWIDEHLDTNPDGVKPAAVAGQ